MRPRLHSSFWGYLLRNASIVEITTRMKEIWRSMREVAEPLGGITPASDKTKQAKIPVATNN